MNMPYSNPNLQPHSCTSSYFTQKSMMNIWHAYMTINKGSGFPIFHPMVDGVSFTQPVVDSGHIYPAPLSTERFYESAE